jgi:hypothetical protein
VYRSKPFMVARVLCCLFVDLIWRQLTPSSCGKGDLIQSLPRYSCSSPFRGDVSPLTPVQSTAQKPSPWPPLGTTTTPHHRAGFTTRPGQESEPHRLLIGSRSGADQWANRQQESSTDRRLKEKPSLGLSRSQTHTLAGRESPTIGIRISFRKTSTGQAPQQPRAVLP